MPQKTFVEALTSVPAVAAALEKRRTARVWVPDGVLYKIDTLEIWMGDRGRPVWQNGNCRRKYMRDLNRLMTILDKDPYHTFTVRFNTNWAGCCEISEGINEITIEHYYKQLFAVVKKAVQLGYMVSFLDRSTDTRHYLDEDGRVVESVQLEDWGA